MTQKIVTLFFFCGFLSLGYGKIAISANFGSSSILNSASFAYSVKVYHQVDNQTFIGLSSGQEQDGIPLLATAFIRLPLGSTYLPVVTGDIGYMMREINAGFMWKAGGGIDWKNGKYSSILIMAGYETIQYKGSNETGIYGTLGLLIEF